MVGADDQHGVAPQIELVHGIEHPPQRTVAHRHQRRIFVADMRHGVRALGDRSVYRPVELRPVIGVRVDVLVVLLGKERLVRIEGLDLHEPFVVGAIGMDEFEAGVEGQRLRLD